MKKLWLATVQHKDRFFYAVTRLRKTEDLQENNLKSTKLLDLPI